MTFAELTTEISSWIQRDSGSTFSVWSEIDIEDAIIDAFEGLADSLPRQKSSSCGFSTTEVTLPTNYRLAFHAVISTKTIPLLNPREVDYISGDPYNVTGSSMEYLSEMSNSSGTKVLRVFPKLTSASGNVSIKYLASHNIPANDEDTIYLNDSYLPLLKYRAIAILLRQNGPGKDVKKAEVFDSLYESIKSIVVGLFPLGDLIR